MAAEAVLKVREAEEKARETLSKSAEEAKEIINNAGSEGEKKRRAILDEAYESKKRVIETAVGKAGEECLKLSDDGEKAKAGILNPDKKKFKKAEDLVIERIVNYSGHC
jgi:V/A-type H+-transporting ATPase subunit G/H